MILDMKYTYYAYILTLTQIWKLKLVTKLNTYRARENNSLAMCSLWEKNFHHKPSLKYIQFQKMHNEKIQLGDIPTK